jgi:hypothetical protein
MRYCNPNSRNMSFFLLCCVVLCSAVSMWFRLCASATHSNRSFFLMCCAVLCCVSVFPEYALVYTIMVGSSSWCVLCVSGPVCSFVYPIEMGLLPVVLCMFVCGFVYALVYPIVICFSSCCVVYFYVVPSMR